MPNDTTPAPNDKGASYNEGNHDPSNSLTTRKRRLTQICYERADALNRAVSNGKYEWAERRVTSSRQRKEIETLITRLAERMKVDHSELSFGQTYIESLRRLTVWNEQGKPDLSGAEKDADAARLAKLSDGIHERASALRQAEYAKKFETPQADATPKRTITIRRPSRPETKKKPPTYRIDLIHRGAENLGYIRGESLEAEEAAATLKVGDPAAAWQRDEDDATSGRVIAADAQTFTIREANGDETVFNRATCAWAGRITGTLPTLPKEQRDRLAELRKKLDRLGNEDDQIIRCTARYEIEKQIYDIEHPVGADPDDWGAWEEKGGADGNG